MPKSIKGSALKCLHHFWRWDLGSEIMQALLKILPLENMLRLSNVPLARDGPWEPLFCRDVKGRGDWMALGVGSGGHQAFLPLVHRSNHSHVRHCPRMALK